MKKLVYLFVVVLLLLALVPATASADPITVDLLAGQTTNIGYVDVWNDADTLYVKFVSTGDCLKETHVAVATNVDDIPQTKKGNPIPGQFEYSDPHACVQEYTYEIQLAWDYGTPLIIAAHAACGVEESMWVFSNGDESFTAYTGPGTTSYPCEQGDPRSGTAVAAWQHSAWQSVTSQFDYGTWIWEAYRAADPICGTVVDFEETFDIPGEISDGTLWVTADNGYEAYLNGTLLETDGLSGDWRNSDLTESYVTTAMSAWSSIEIATWLQLTGNTLRFETANEYFNTDDGHSSAGTVDSNPGGLIYEAEITYYADGETAWGNGTEFPGNNWGMYFTYTVQEPPKDWNLPTGQVKLRLGKYLPGYAGTYFDVALSNVGTGYDIYDETWPSWCVDSHVYIYPSTDYWPYAYSSLDPDLGTKCPYCVDDEDWEYVNYILNHKDPTATWKEVQAAIWYFTDENPDYQGYWTSKSQAMVDNARQYGAGFYPVEGQIGAVILGMGSDVQLVFIEVDP